MRRSGLEERIAALERENAIIKKKLDRSMVNRKLMEDVLASHVQALKVLNAEIAESQESVLASISDGLFLLDNEWRITYANATALQIAFPCMGDVVGKNLWEINRRAQPFYDEYHRAKMEGEPVHFEAALVCTNTLIEVYAYPIQRGLLVIFRDVTEKRMLEKEVARLDRLSLVGEMAAGIAHEIRNPMTTVRGFLQHFLRKEEFAKHNSDLQLMISELDRANFIICEYLSLAKNKLVSSSAQSLNTIIRNMLPLIESEALLKGKWITTKLSEDIPELILDAQEIRQLILNLAKNGLEAMVAGGKLTVGTYEKEECVVLFIQDNGNGIPPEVHKNIGMPFLTTKENGIGLGLPICYSIAQRHHAKIDVVTGESGTTFMVKFSLPINNAV